MHPQEGASSVRDWRLIHLVVLHINAVTSAMRLSPRWSLSALSSSSPLGSVTASTSVMSLTKEAHIMATEDEGANTVGLFGGFTVLRTKLRLVSSPRDIPLPELVTHFLRVILSERTTGTVTRTALEAVHSFLEHGLFSPNSVGLARAVQDVAHATSHCSFEPSDSSMDEVVLLAILDVMYQLVCGRAGAAASDAPMLVDLLGDESVCEMMETGLSMCCQTRLSTTLRRTAEKTVQRMFCTLFARLEDLSSDDAQNSGEQPEHATLVAEVGGDDNGLRMATPNPKSNQVPAAGLSDEAEPEGEENEEGGKDEQATRSEPPPSAESPEAPEKTTSSESPSAPFGLAALVEVLRVLVALLDPRSTRHTNTMRLLGLNILGTLLEAHGTSIVRFPMLRALIEDSAMRHMVQLACSDNSVVVARALRVLNVTFDCMRTDLKMQQELVLRFFIQQLQPVIPIAAAPWSDEKQSAAPPLLTWVDGCATGELRVLMLEAFCLFLDAAGGTSDVFVNLWRNYDCDMSCSNMYDELLNFLCRMVYTQPLTPNIPRPLTGLQLVATDAVLSFVDRMAKRLEAPITPEDESLHDQLHAQHERKGLLARCAAEFNRKPSAGIASLEAAGLVNPDSRANSIARFLSESANVDKRLLGDYLSRPENIDVLSAFIGLFNFDGIDVADAMRELCEAFRLPGEAQQISRITETFARTYFATSPPGIRSEDAVYVLAYSVIMLNTDLHNPQVTRRMSVTDYQRNLRGVNEGADFDAGYLAQLYDSIRRREIVMPEEHAGELGFDYAWKELLRRSRTAGPVLDTNTSAFDRDMFRTSWKPLVASIMHAFSELSDERMLQRTIAACRQCATFADTFDVPEVHDFMVQHFANATGLANAPNTRGVPTAVRRVQESEVTISPLSIQFGANFKGQLAAVVLFTIANGSGNAIRGGWNGLYAVLESLLVSGLLPQGMANRYVASNGTHSREPITLRVRGAPQATTPSGLFGTLSSYFLSPYTSSEAQLDVSDTDVEHTMSTLECLTSCHLDEIDAQNAALSGEARDALAESLIQRLEPHTKVDDESPVYDPAVVFLLDRLAGTASPRAFDTHINFIKTPGMHSLIVEAGITGALRLAAAHDTETGKTELLHVLPLCVELPVELHASIAGAVLDGMWTFVVAHPNSLHTEQEWTQFLRALMAFSRIRRARCARAARGLGTYLIENEANRYNYATLVEQLRELALAADRALWRSAADSASGPRRTLTEKREQSNWEAAVREQSVAAVVALQKSAGTVPEIVRSVPWTACWLPLLASLAQQCVNAYRPTRSAATTALERVIVSPGLTESAPQPALASLALVFENILFPLMETLLRPDAQRADQLDGGAGDSTVRTRERVCMVIGKAWLLFAGSLISDARAADSDRLLKLWKGVLASYTRVLRGPHGEAVVEQLKNVLLVTHSSGLAADAADDKVSQDAWAAAWTAIGPVLPELHSELFPQQ